MESIVGIFRSASVAEQAIDDMVRGSMARDAIVFLSSQRPTSAGETTTRSSEQELDRLPTTDAEGDGMGKAMGAVLGGAIGGSAGLGAGAAVASLLVPGVGTIFAIGIGAAALLGLGGAAAGAKAGDSIEIAADTGVPRDDVQFYHDLLKSGRSLVIANVRSGAEASLTRDAFNKRGSEDTETARRELHNAA